AESGHPIPKNSKNGQVEFSMFVFGRGSIGDDGFAFRYKRDDKMIQGPPYGSDSKFTGPGIIFDSSEHIEKTDLRQNGHTYSNCFTVSGYYFGVTTSTGQRVTDDHDILEIKGYDVNQPPKKVDHATHHLSDAEK
ncbi:hypothetical protein HK098_008341, partial [Nowakowskiella sp. JEL0407]